MAQAILPLPLQHQREGSLGEMRSGRMGVLVSFSPVIFSIALIAAGGTPMVALSPTPLGWCGEDVLVASLIMKFGM